MVDITVDFEDLQPVLGDLKATTKQLDRSITRAINKTTDQVHSHIIRHMAKQHDIPAKALRKQLGGYKGRVLKRKANRRRNTGRVWVGKNPIKSGYVGRLKNAPDYGGAFARKYFFKGGFIAQMRSGHTGIFARHATQTMRNKNKAAISETTVELVKADAIAKAARDDVPKIFEKVFAQEFNYEINVKGQR